ncbi:MAG TPA: hypothetical protein VG488_04375 [Candidatus Angelobacter sp.]|jgi:hypothetical protein|nr:hypothetical protein [Candidatus Angelobacter sp.]
MPKLKTARPSKARLKKAKPQKIVVAKTKSKQSVAKGKPAAKTAGKGVPPESVRVWRGYKLSSLPQQTFLANLGGIFIPVTAILQRLYGLTAYLPTVLPTDKPSGVPDEIALVFYTAQQAYNDTKLIVAGRAYSLLHSAVFDLTQSQSGFPTLLGNKLDFDTPYYLFPESADWQSGFSQVFVGTRKANVQPPAFAASILAFLDHLRKHHPAGLDGAVVCVSSDWVIYWEHWKTEGASLHGQISGLAELADLLLLQPYTPTAIDSSMTDHYPGLTVEGGESFNILFPLADNSKPAKESAKK